MPSQMFLLIFFLSSFFLIFVNSLSVSSNYTSGKIPSLINATQTIIPSLLTVTSKPLKRAMTLEDLTPAAQAYHPTSKSYGNDYSHRNKQWGKKSHGWGSNHHGNHGHHNNHGHKSYSHDDDNKYGKEHEDYSKGSRGKHWDNYGEKEKVVKDKGSGFIKAFTWDREEVKRDKWGNKGGEYDRYNKGSKGKEYGKKSSKGRGYSGWGQDHSQGSWGGKQFENTLSDYSALMADQGLTWHDLQGLEF